jgi:hypothetical protein
VRDGCLALWLVTSAATLSAQTPPLRDAGVEGHHHLAAIYDEAALSHLRALYHHVMRHLEFRTAADHDMLLEHTRAVATALEAAQRQEDAAERGMSDADRASTLALCATIRAAYVEAMAEQEHVEHEAVRTAPNLSVIAEHVRDEHAAVSRARQAQAELRRALGVPDPRPLPTRRPPQSLPPARGPG